MTTTSHGDIYADTTGLDYDDDYDLRPGPSNPFPLATAQPAPRPPRQPIRARMAVVADDALRSPRWDQARGLVVLACVTVVGAVLSLLFALTVLIGAVVLFRTMMEAL